MKFLSRHRPSPAMAVAMIALFVALGGTSAYALQGRNTVDSGDIINQQVRSADVQNGGVRSVDVRNDGLRSIDVLDGTLTAIDVAFGSLRGDEIQDGTLSGSDVAGDSLTGSDIDESSLGQVPSAASAGVAQSIANGSVTAGKLGTITRRTNSVVVAGGVAGNGTYATQQVAAVCNSGEIALSGGAEWANNSIDDELPITEAFVYFAGGKPDRFIAHGGNDTSVDRTLVASVFCLAP